MLSVARAAQAISKGAWHRALKVGSVQALYAVVDHMRRSSRKTLSLNCTHVMAPLIVRAKRLRVREPEANEHL